MPRSSNSWPGWAKLTTDLRKRRDQYTSARPDERHALDRVLVDALRAAPRARELDARQVVADRADRGRDAHLVVVEDDQHRRAPVADVVERLERHAAHEGRVADHDSDALVRATHLAGERKPLRDGQAGAGVAAVEDVVRALRCAAGNRRHRPAGAACRSRSSRPVSSLCAYAWWPVSHTILSVGLFSRRCRVTVSSTTPSELPRWPPVFATVPMIVPRISAHSSMSCSSLSLRRSRGLLRLARRDKACSATGSNSDERHAAGVVPDLSACQPILRPTCWDGSAAPTTLNCPLRGATHGGNTAPADY